MARPHLNRELWTACEDAMVKGVAWQVRDALADEQAVAKSTVDKYYRLIREKWATEEEELRPMRRQEFRARVLDTYRLAHQTGNAMAAAATLRVMAKLDGLEAPAKVEITGSIDVRAMTPLQRQEEIERLIAVRAEALDLPLQTPSVLQSPRPTARGTAGETACISPGTS